MDVYKYISCSFFFSSIVILGGTIRVVEGTDGGPLDQILIRSECGNKIKIDDQNPLWLWLGQINLGRALSAGFDQTRKGGTQAYYNEMYQVSRAGIFKGLHSDSVQENGCIRCLHYYYYYYYYSYSKTDHI